MLLSEYNNINLLRSEKNLSLVLEKTESEIFELQFQKKTSQKSGLNEKELKSKKRRVAQIYTILRFRELDDLRKNFNRTKDKESENGTEKIKDI